MVLTIASYVTAFTTIVTTITVAISKVFDHKLKPLANRDRLQMRYQIVHFACTLHNGVPHTRDEYLAIFELITEYSAICRELNITNHVFEEECEYIHNRYQDLEENR